MAAGEGAVMPWGHIISMLDFGTCERCWVPPQHMCTMFSPFANQNNEVTRLVPIVGQCYGGGIDPTTTDC